MRQHLIAMAAASALSGMIESRHDGLGLRMVENRGQAMPKGAQRAIRESRDDRKASKRAAAAELVRISNETLVVAHLHPRWLRGVVEDAMDRGATVTHADVDRWRAMGETEARVGMFHGDFGQGPEGARMIVEAYRG